ncbi:unnamed protein product [Rhizophagus irregularis]|nr:unnamed protein product [Rhizophagus irregularis]
MNLAKKNNSSITKTSKKGGRPFSEVWKTGMKRGEPKGDGHYSGTCEYCSTHWKRAKPISLKIHLTKCNSAPSEIREYWKRELYGTEEENSDSDIEILNSVNPKRKKNFNKKIIKKPRINESHQSDIRNHFTNTKNELEIGVIDTIDKALLNAFILENGKSEISNIAVLTILQKRGIFDDIQKLAETLLPIKDAILSLERNNANLADCYINLLRELFININNIIRYEEFNDPKYLLAFFLHPEWKGTLVTASEFDNLLELAGELWKEWGHKQNSTSQLYSQIRKYRLGKKPYNKPYSSKHDTPLNWWLLINDGWFFGKRRQRLQLKTLQSMAKIHRYSLLHMKTSVGHLSETYDDEELRDLLFEMSSKLEDTNDDDFDETTINQDMARARELERVIIEARPAPVLTRKFDSSDDDDNCKDFDPKELANRYRIDIEDSEDTNEDNGNSEDNGNNGNNVDNENNDNGVNNEDDEDNENNEGNEDNEDNEDNEGNEDNEDNEDNKDNESYEGSEDDENN